MPSILDNSVELRHLRYFVAVANAGGFTRAAAIIGLKQPTLSHQIHQLEQTIGAPLFHRARRLCRLTAAGELLLPYARRIISDMEDARRSLNDLSGLRRGTLHLAALPVAAHYVLPETLARFRAEHPGIRVRALELSVDDMERALVRGEVELGIGFVPPSETSLQAQALYREELVAVVAPDDPLAQKKTITVGELATRPLVVPPAGFGTRILILSAFAKARATPMIALELSSLDALLSIVARGGGTGVLPESALWGRQAGETVAVRIQRPTPHRQMGLLHVRGVHLSPAAEAFTAVLSGVVQTASAAQSAG
ncbi:MAG: LysR family transcriptional regulator [Opitutaceae bacterium]|nr:LysR family transcriptional regulator [Opitutaceae bacterium]